ncbi:4Fe-4S dicluster domain-containing protein [Candidatus Bathyarchaeota archaeon]|nr:MAG: 4Fe-4S dicluster domain-containing protein [Candidatus Bathyarchaeota archaeon]
MSGEKPKIWIFRDYERCSGCRRCEIVCSIRHEGRIWPEASRVRVFMPIPGLEIPHLCTQCPGYPCVEACPFDALLVDKNTGAVIVDRDKCTGCGKCIGACPGQVPFIHPRDGYAVICDLCGGEPECVKVCVEAGYNALMTVPRSPSETYKVYARTPQDIAKDLVSKLYGEEWEGWV